MNRAAFYGLALLILLVDQATKAWLVATLPRRANPTDRGARGFGAGRPPGAWPLIAMVMSETPSNAKVLRIVSCSRSRRV